MTKFAGIAPGRSVNSAIVFLASRHEAAAPNFPVSGGERCRGMKRMHRRCLAAVATLMLAASAAMAQAQILPPTEPIPRIEPGMHNGRLWSIDVDAKCRLLVTGSDDKTARLWALPENGTGAPKLLRVLRVPIGPGNNEGNVDAVALSPDGQFAAVGGWDVAIAQTHDDAVYIFENASGKLIHRLGKNDSVITHVTFSADGRFLAATLGGGAGLRVWDTATWSLVGEDKDYGRGPSYGVAFGPGGELYTVSNDGFLRRYGSDFKLEAKSKVLGGEKPYSLAVHPSGDRVALGFDDSTAVEIYAAKDLKRLFTADTTGVSNRESSGHFYGIAWSPDGTQLYAGGQHIIANGIRAVRIWDREGHGKGHDVAVAQGTIMQLVPCRDAIAVGVQDPAFGLISLAGKRLLWQESANPNMRLKLGANFTVSDDGSKVRFGLGVGSTSPVLFDLATGRLTDQPQPADGLAAPDTASLKLSGWNLSRAPKLDGKPLEMAPNEIARSAAIAPGSDRFVLGTEWFLRGYDRNGKELWRRPVPGIARGVNIPRGGKFVIVAYSDGTIRWVRLSDGVELLALFVNAKTREWVLWTPQGYYTSSAAGDHNIGWQLNQGWEHAGEFITAARLKKHLYRPDIIKRAFELASTEGAIKEAGLSGFKLADLTNHKPPEFRIDGPGDKSRVEASPLPVKLEFAANDDPLTGFDVKVNGRQVTPRAVHDIAATSAAKTSALNIPLEKGENHIQVTAHNAVGDSVRDMVVYLDHEGVLDKKGKLFILAIGVDKYPKLGTENSLHYAAADARLMLDTLTKRAGPLHTQVISKLLVSGGAIAPTKANIEDALLFLHDAGPEDTVMLFLAGHGVNEGANYLYMPEDAEGLDQKFWRPSTVLKPHHVRQHLPFARCLQCAPDQGRGRCQYCRHLGDRQRHGSAGAKRARPRRLYVRA